MGERGDKPGPKEDTGGLFGGLFRRLTGEHTKLPAEPKPAIAPTSPKDSEASTYYLGSKEAPDDTDKKAGPKEPEPETYDPDDPQPEFEQIISTKDEIINKLIPLNLLASEPEILDRYKEQFKNAGHTLEQFFAELNKLMEKPDKLTKEAVAKQLVINEARAQAEERLKPEHRIAQYLSADIVVKKGEMPDFKKFDAASGRDILEYIYEYLSIDFDKGTDSLKNHLEIGEGLKKINKTPRSYIFTAKELKPLADKMTGLSQQLKDINQQINPVN